MNSKIATLVLAAAFSSVAAAQTAPAEQAVAPATQTQEERIAALEKKIQDMEKSTVTGKTKGGLELKVYGYARLDGNWIDSNVQTTGGGAVFKWTKPESDVTEEDDQFNMTARATRVGLDMVGPTSDTFKSSAKIEFDFCGSNDSETNNHPRLRHGYLQLDMPESDFSILAGQTWDLLAPVLPPMLDSSALWWQGNVGMRRAQLRLTKGFSIDDATSVKFEGAIARNVGGLTSGSGIDSGSDSGIPVFQGRVSLTTPIFNGEKSTFGFSGLYGQEEYDLSADSDANEKFDNCAMAFDMTVPVTKSTQVLGELTKGSNVGNYGGGIGQTVNTNFGEEIDATCGWVALSQKLNDQFSVAGGYGMDSADSDDLNTGNRESNETIFTNVTYKPVSYFSTGFELAYNETEYKDSDSGDSIRASMMFQYNF